MKTIKLTNGTTLEEGKMYKREKCRPLEIVKIVGERILYIEFDEDRTKEYKDRTKEYGDCLTILPTDEFYPYTPPARKEKFLEILITSYAPLEESFIKYYKSEEDFKQCNKTAIKENWITYRILRTVKL